jgi:hypothetical protein
MQIMKQEQSRFFIWRQRSRIPDILNWVELTPEIFLLQSHFSLCQRPCNASCCSSLDSHHGDQGSIPRQSMWGLWWTKSFVFHCQYHYTSPSYSFIHLWPTLYNLSNCERREITHSHGFSIKDAKQFDAEQHIFLTQNHVLPRRSKNRVNVIKPQALGTSEHTGLNIFKRSRVAVVCDCSVL